MAPILITKLFLHNSIIIFLVLILQSFTFFSLETDTISGGVVLKDPDRMVSPKEVFKMGFFSPANTTNRYLGIFFAFSEETVIWVANREKPLKDSSGAVVRISEDGNLVVMDGTNQTVWSTNISTSPVNVNSSIQLLDNRNLVLRDVATGETSWESFSEPTDALVQGMTVSQNVKTGKRVALSAWKNASDPGIGRFSVGVDGMSGIGQLLALDEGRPHWRSGPWNGLIFLGLKEMFYSHMDWFLQVKNDSMGNIIYSKLPDNMYIDNINSSGSVTGKWWDDKEKRWKMVWETPQNECDLYSKCGPFGSCNPLKSPMCTCLRGFEPADEGEWGRGNWSSGCTRRNQLQCGMGGEGDAFARLRYMKVPDFAQPLSSRVEDQCRTICMANCSCIAYAYDLNIGCMFWSNTLIDVQEFDSVGVDLYIRLSASDFDSHKGRKLYIITPIVAFVCLSIMTFIAWWLMVKRKHYKKTRH